MNRLKCRSHKYDTFATVQIEHQYLDFQTVLKQDYEAKMEGGINYREAWILILDSS